MRRGEMYDPDPPMDLDKASRSLRHDERVSKTFWKKQCERRAALRVAKATWRKAKKK